MYNFGKQSGLHSRNWAFFVEKLTLSFTKLRIHGEQTRKLSCRTSLNYFQMFIVLGMYNFGKQSGLHSINRAFLLKNLHCVLLSFASTANKLESSAAEHHRIIFRNLQAFEVSSLHLGLSVHRFSFLTKQIHTRAVGSCLKLGGQVLVLGAQSKV